MGGAGVELGTRVAHSRLWLAGDLSTSVALRRSSVWLLEL